MSQSMCLFSVNSSVIYHEANESNLPARHASQVRYRQTREAQLNMIYKARPYSQTSSSPEKDLESAEFWQSPSGHCGSTPVYSFLFCARPRNQGGGTSAFLLVPSAPQDLSESPRYSREHGPRDFVVRSGFPSNGVPAHRHPTHYHTAARRKDRGLPKAGCSHLPVLWS